MRPILAAGAALVLTLALTVAFLPRGGDPPTEEAALGDAPALTVLDPETVRARGVPAPAWRPGNAWTVSFEPSGFACRLVVMEPNASGYRQASACEGAPYLASEDAVFQYAFMGEFGEGLEGLRADAPPVVFYQWPLVDGKRWATEWFGFEMDVVATYDAKVPGPRGEEPGFRLTMAHEGETIVEYDYVPSIGWWSGIRIQGGFRMEVEAFDPEWRGEAYVARAEARLAIDGNTGFRFPRSFTVPPEDDLLLLVERNEGSTVQGLVLLDPDNDVAYNEVAPPLVGSQRFRATYLDPQPGDWTAVPLQVGGGGALTTVHGLQIEALTV